MENQKKSYLSLPSNYVTLAQLQQRWLEQKNHKEKEKQQQQQEEEEEPIMAAPRNGTTSPTEDSGTNRREPEAGAGIGDESTDLDTKVAESSKKKMKKKKRYQKPKPKVDEKAASEERPKGTIRSEVNEKKSVVDSVKVEEQAEQKFRASSVKGKQNRRMNKVEWKESIVEGSKNTIGTVWNEKKNADDSVKVVEEVEQKFAGLAFKTMKGKQDGRMNQKGASEEGSKAAIRTVLNEKKSVDDSVNAEKEIEHKLGGLTVITGKGKQNGRMRRMNQKGASEGDLKTAIVGSELNEKKSVDDSVKVEKEIEQKLGGLTVITVKGKQDGRMRRMNQKGASEGYSKAAIVGSELNEKKSVDDLVKAEKEIEQKLGGLTVITGKGKRNRRMRRINQKGASEGDLKAAIVGRVLNEKKSVDDSVKVEKENEQKFGGLTVITVKGKHDGRMRRMNQKGASEGDSKAAIVGSELNEKKSVDDLVKAEKEIEQKLGGLTVITGKGKRNRRMRRINQKGASEGDLKTAIVGRVLNEKKSVDDSVKVEKENEQKLGGLTVITVKGKHDGRMRRMNQKGASEGDSKAAIVGSELNEKKSVDDLVKAEKEIEQKLGGLTLITVKGKQNGRMRRMNHKGASEGDSKTSIVGSELNEKKSVDDSVKAEKEIEQKLGGLTVITVKGKQNGRMRRMNQIGVSEGVGSELNEKKSVDDSVKAEKKIEQKLGASLVKGNHNWRMRRMNDDDGFCHSQSQGDIYGGRNYGYGYGYDGYHPRRAKSDKMVWVRKDGVGDGEIESET